jgi:hypothetical protein
MSEKNKPVADICIMSEALKEYGRSLLLFLMMAITFFLSGCTKEENPDLSNSDLLIIAGINEVIPANLAESVELNPVLTVIFKPETAASVLSESSLTLKKGQTDVPGKTMITGASAIFTPDNDLLPETEYTAIVRTGHKSGEDDSKSHEYSWKFKTGTHYRNNTLKVVSTYPPNKSTAVSVTTQLNVTFSSELAPAMKNSDLIVLTNGQSAVSGTLSYSGSIATFKPDGNLSPKTFYAVKVRLGLGSANDDYYNWSFTTEGDVTDVTPPAVTSVVPANNATSVDAGSTLKVIFSETMDPATMNAANISLEQGTVPVPGTVAFSGVTATFKPVAALTPNTVYTGTVTTAVKDAAGNPMATVFTWSFTTAPAIVLLSFKSDVVPVLLQCNNCHTHPWTTSSNASTFYSNLVSEGYIKTSSPSTSKIYTKLNSGHPGSGISQTDINKILTWFTQGATNN